MKGEVENRRGVGDLTLGIGLCGARGRKKGEVDRWNIAWIDGIFIAESIFGSKVALAAPVPALADDIPFKTDIAVMAIAFAITAAVHTFRKYLCCCYVAICP